MVVLASGYFVNSDIKLNNFEVPAGETSLEVSTQKEDCFLIIPIRCDGGHNGTFITLWCDTRRPSNTC